MRMNTRHTHKEKVWNIKKWSYILEMDLHCPCNADMTIKMVKWTVNKGSKIHKEARGNQKQNVDSEYKLLKN